MSIKQKAKLKKRSEHLTEKAVHQMIESRKMSKDADHQIREANAAVSKIPALQGRARQAKLVLKVLEAQRKSDMHSLADSNPKYRAALRLSHRLVAEAAKDKRMSKQLSTEASAAKSKRTSTSKAAEATGGSLGGARKVPRPASRVASELARLRQVLVTEKSEVEDDDSILSALREQSHPVAKPS